MGLTFYVMPSSVWKDERKQLLWEPIYAYQFEQWEYKKIKMKQNKLYSPFLLIALPSVLHSSREIIFSRR